VSQRCNRLNQSWLLQKPQGADAPSARALTANLQQLRLAIKASLTSAMENPMSNIIFGMAPAGRSFKLEHSKVLFRMRRLQGD
jgi:hypothetical protein